jgi:hypothetical protein
MKNRQFAWYNFNNFGYILYKFTDEELKPLWDEVNEIQENFTNGTTWNHELAGHLKHEYELTKCRNHISDLVKPLTKGYNQTFDYYKSITFLSKAVAKNVKIKLDTLWVNYQRKGEFNPVHDHGGILSFVIWLKMPYTIEDESTYFGTSIKPEQERTATFNFYYTNSLGDITNTTIPVDKTYENTICIFPAKMKHAVYPFYTSDDYRISVSGNFCVEPL